MNLRRSKASGSEYPKIKKYKKYPPFNCLKGGSNQIKMLIYIKIFAKYIYKQNGGHSTVFSKV